MRRDCGLALSLPPRAWDRQERHGEGCGWVGGSSTPPPPMGNWLWLHCCADGMGAGSVFGFLAFHLCLGSWFGLSGDLGRGARLVAGSGSMSGLCHLIGFLPALRARSNIKRGPRLVPGLMELGKRLPDVCSCFLPLPTQSLELETHVSCSVGHRAPGSGLGRLVSPSPTRDHSFPLIKPLSPSSVPLLPSKESFLTLSTGKSSLLYSLHPSCSQGLSSGTAQRSRGRNSLKQRGRKERCSG